MAELHEHIDLTPWTPTPAQLPEKWKQVAIELAHKAKGMPQPSHAYALGVKYNVKDVGDLLHSWGLPWQVVIAGYLLPYEEGIISAAGLNETEQILAHIQGAMHYKHCIEEDDLLTLLNPPYNDTGDLLTAVAIHYAALQEQLWQSNGHLLKSKATWQIESIGRTLLNIAKRLGMWDFKRQLEDLIEQLRNPTKFAEDKKEHTRILERDLAQIEATSQELMACYEETVAGPILVKHRICDIAGLRRRRQDAHTTATTPKNQLTGFDLVTFDVVVPTVKDCYAAFGAFSQLGYIQDRVTDQIANPKTNGYSHIALGLILKSLGLPCQIQIATRLLQAIMRFGCLHPSCYHIYMDRTQFGKIHMSSRRYFWGSEEGMGFSAIRESIIKGHIQYQKENQADSERPHKPIIVYDKNRTPIALPKYATALDFAYAVSPTMGERAVEAFINNRKEPLFRILDAGDVVEIRTSREIQAQDYWLDDAYTATTAARNQIHESLKRRYPERRGYDLIRKVLERYHCTPTADILEEHLRELVKQHQLGTLQSYLEQLDPAKKAPYTPEWTAQLIMQRIAEHNNTPSIEESHWMPVELASVDNSFRPRRLCSVCQPTYPRDMKIVGYQRRKKGDLVVHREGCARLIAHTNKGSSRSLLLPMKWHLEPPVFKIAFYVTAQDRRGLILDITKQLRRYQSAVTAFHADAFPKSKKAEIRFVIETANDDEVLTIWEQVLSVDSIISVDIDTSSTPSYIAARLQEKRQHHASLQEKASRVSQYWDDTIRSLGQRSNVLKNPYDISRPASSKMFYGRFTEIKRLQRTLCDGEYGKALIMYGPRRSGKSSLCKNFLEHHVHAPLWHALFSLQGSAQHSEETILMNLAEEICTAFQQQLGQPALGWHDYTESDPQVRFRHVIEECIAQVPGSRLVLALDEFGGVLESYERHILEPRFFTFWRDLMSRIPQLSLILALPTNSYTVLKAGTLSNAFSFAESLLVTFLDRENAERLLIEPLREQQIAIHPGTVLQAFLLSNGNPYYLTLLGSQLISQLNQEPRKQQITDDDLILAVNHIIEPGSTQYFTYYLSELQNDDESRVLEKIVELTCYTKQPTVSLKKLIRSLNMPGSMVKSLLERLRDGLILEEFKRNAPNAEPYYSFKIELIWRWMINNSWFFTNLAFKKQVSGV